jgi:hypothetical protein
MPLSQSLINEIELAKKTGQLVLNNKNPKLNDTDISELVLALISVHSITYLDVRNNQIVPLGAGALAQNTTLRTLHLCSGNNLTISDLRPFLQNTILTTFPIVGGSGALLKSIREHIKQNASRIVSFVTFPAMSVPVPLPIPGPVVVPSVSNIVHGLNFDSPARQLSNMKEIGPALQPSAHATLSPVKILGIYQPPTEKSGVTIMAANANEATPTTKTIMSMAPINSSGDIYHILSYIMLTLHYKISPVPRILLSYDADDTKTQIERSLNLAKALGYGEYFAEAVHLNPSAFHQNVRQKTLEDYLKSQLDPQTSTIHYLDQKSSTSFVAQYFIQDRLRSSSILREGYGRRNSQEISSTAQNTLRDYADYWIRQINQSRVNNQPVVILHIRHSGDANESQNLPGNFLTKFAQYIEDKGGYRVWYIFADGRKTGSFTGIDARRISPFSDPLKKDKANYSHLNQFSQALLSEKQNYDYGKLRHLQLLLRLHELGSNDLKGIIGNTSGTLDLAGFIGHNVYNIHNLKSASIAYQDYRILIQMSFLSVDFFKKIQYDELEKSNTRNWRNYEITTADIKPILPNIYDWLRVEGMPIMTSPLTFCEPKYENAGFWELLYCDEITRTSDRLLELPFAPGIKRYVRERFLPSFSLTSGRDPQPHILSTVMATADTAPTKVSVPILFSFESLKGSVESGNEAIKKNKETLKIIPAGVIPGEPELYELDVPADGTCLFYSAVFSYLLPVLHYPVLFHQRFVQIFGEESGQSSEEYRTHLTKYNGGPFNSEVQFSVAA